MVPRVVGSNPISHPKRKRFIEPLFCFTSTSVFKKMSNFAANLKSAMNRNYKINLRREPEGGYTVFVPSLPGCITYGETVDEAIDMAKEAIGLYIEELEERGESVPDDSNVLEYSLNMATV